MKMVSLRTSQSVSWTARTTSWPWNQAGPDLEPGSGRGLRAVRALPGSRVPANSIAGPQAPTSSAAVQRCECEHPGTSADIGQVIQRRGAQHGGLRASVGHDVRRLVDAPGQELGLGIRRFMESRFAQDFSDVRIHRGPDAEASAGDLRAIAYTAGSHIVFGSGAYRPETSEGSRLLAHELSHVVQQRRGPVTGEPVGGLRVSSHDDSFERSADADASAVLSEPVSVQRQDLAPPQQDAAGPAGSSGPDCSCSDDDVLAYQSAAGPDTLGPAGHAAGPPVAVQAFPAPSSQPGTEVQRQPDPPASGAGVAPAPDAGSAAQSLPKPCSPDAKACFSISKKAAWLKLASGVITVSALGGRNGHPTPLGKSFKVIQKDKDHRSSLYKVKGKGAPMPFYVNFAPAVGFHAGSLTTPSHGCVHLSASDAEKFFNNLEVGDRVDVIE